MDISFKEGDSLYHLQLIQYILPEYIELLKVAQYIVATQTSLMDEEDDDLPWKVYNYFIHDCDECRSPICIYDCPDEGVISFVSDKNIIPLDGEEVVIRRRSWYNGIDTGCYYKLSIDSGKIDNPEIYRGYLKKIRISVNGNPVYRIVKMIYDDPILKYL